MKILKRSDYGVTEIFERVFNLAEYGSYEFRGGFGFECDAAGNVDVTKLNPVAADNWRQALTGVVDGRPVLDLGVIRLEHAWREPAEGECNRCRRTVVLSGFTNTCECGADYNSAGQELAPREQWGEETGETASDILMGADDPHALD